MNDNSLSIDQVRIFASTLRRRANATIHEYIASVQGRGTLSIRRLSVRFELLNEVVAEVHKVAPDFVEEIPFFNLAKEIESRSALFSEFSSQRGPQPHSHFHLSPAPKHSPFIDCVDDY